MFHTQSSGQDGGCGWKKETKEEPEYSLPSADFNINRELIRLRRFPMRQFTLGRLKSGPAARPLKYSRLKSRIFNSSLSIFFRFFLSSRSD